MRKFFDLVFILLCAAQFSWAVPNDPFAPQQGVQRARTEAGQTVSLSVQLPVPAGHYLYAEKVQLSWDSLHGMTAENFAMPEPKEKFDPFLEETVAIYPEALWLGADITVPADMAAGRYTIQATLSYQGCSPSLCYRGMRKALEWTVQVGDVAAASTEIVRQGTGVPPSTAVVSFGAAFLGGFVTGFTPCILPLLPVVLLIIGVSAGNLRRNFLLSCSLAAGLACTYAVVGLVGAQLGQPIGYLFQQLWFLIVLSVFFAAMALSMFGLFSLQLPSSWQNRLQKVGGAGPRGAFLAGISTGILATPCAGPVVAGLVAYAGVQGDPLHGFGLLLSFGAGLGALFIVVGTFYGSVASRLPKGPVLVWVKRVLGLLLLLPALYYGWAAYSSITVDGVQSGVWYTNENVAFAEAARAGKPVIIDFTAKTCPPCMVMKRTTYQDAGVLSALEHEIVPLRVDATVSTDRVDALVEKYGVVGWPTILFVNADGTVWGELTQVGRVVPAEELLQLVAESRSRMQ